MKIILGLFNTIINMVGWVCVIALLLMIGTVFIDVFMRYIAVDVLKALDLYLWYDEHISWLGGIAMQELEWHFFSAMFLLGLGYTLRENAHVRVDVLYDNFSRTQQAWINIIGALVFALPFSILLLHYSAGFFYESFQSMENKGDPGSLPRLWPVKLVIPTAFVFLILSIITVMLSELLVIKQEKGGSE